MKRSVFVLGLAMSVLFTACVSNEDVDEFEEALGHLDSALTRAEKSAARLEADLQPTADVGGVGSSPGEDIIFPGQGDCENRGDCNEGGGTPPPPCQPQIPGYCGIPSLPTFCDFYPDAYECCVPTPWRQCPLWPLTGDTPPSLEDEEAAVMEERFTEKAFRDVIANIITPGCDGSDANAECTPGGGSPWPGSGNPSFPGGTIPANGDPPGAPCPPGQENRGWGCESVCDAGEVWNGSWCIPQRPDYQTPQFCAENPRECWGSTLFCNRNPGHPYCCNHGDHNHCNDRGEARPGAPQDPPPPPGGHAP